jgi:Fic family protein
MAFNPLVPYNDLPPLPPRQDLETKPVLKKCIAANRALAELKGIGDQIPNQSMLIKRQRPYRAYP